MWAMDCRLQTRTRDWDSGSSGEIAEVEDGRGWRGETGKKKDNCYNKSTSMAVCSLGYDSGDVAGTMWTGGPGRGRAWSVSNKAKAGQ